MKLELKVCEGCGGLWLRPQGLRWKYCSHCHTKLRDLPQRFARKAATSAKDQRSTTNDRSTEVSA